VLALLLAAADDPPLPPDRETEHVVQPGETLTGIARRARVPRVLIIEANHLEPPYGVKTGQKLVIPRTRRHKVRKGETGFTIAFDSGVPWRDIATANGVDPEAPVKPGQSLLIPTLIAPPAAVAPASAASQSAAPDFAWPLDGTVRRGFTPRDEKNHHDGLDIRASAGTAVRATAAGKVIFAGKEPSEFGNLVVIDHGDGWNSAYGFLSRATVDEGEEVKQGERIGLVGHTGKARGDELHFELRRNNKPVDPAPELPKRD
jgi:murein DD-endopeptidase MepM/ murein hydrolase activator NlpD